MRISARDRKPSEVVASDIMSSPIIKVQTYDYVDTTAAVMTKSKIKKSLAVVEVGGPLVGIILTTDIAKKLAKILADD
jgi:CBS-domain-containing membrane protein